MSQRAWEVRQRYFGTEHKASGVVQPISGLPNPVCSYCRLKDLMRKARQDGEELSLDVDQRGRTVVFAAPESEAAASIPFIRVALIPRLEDHCVC